MSSLTGTEDVSGTGGSGDLTTEGRGPLTSEGPFGSCRGREEKERRRGCRTYEVKEGPDRGGEFLSFLPLFYLEISMYIGSDNKCKITRRHRAEVTPFTFSPPVARAFGISRTEGV